MAWADQIALHRSAITERATITALAWSFLFLLCASLVFVSQDVDAAHNIYFDSRRVLLAAASVAMFGSCVPLLASARNPLGFSTSFYLLTITAGYLWLSYFTPLQYDQVGARLSAVVSWAAFAAPAILVTKSPLTRNLLTHWQMDRLAGCLILLSAIASIWGYTFGFHVVGMLDSVALRDTLSHPAGLRYAVGIATSAALPFAYAWFYTQKRYVVAAIALVVALTFYPITLNKTALLAPFWLIGISVLLKLTTWRIAVVLSLLLPTVIGLIALAINYNPPVVIFRTINFRMLAIPASALDHYNHFYSTHPLTNFCQVGVIGKLFNCSLPDQLGAMMAKVYATGNYNASLLATEGVASVGIYLAPISGLICGAVIAAGNVASHRLDPALVLLSSAVVLQAILNVPLSTIMITHGGVLLLALWLLAPRRHNDSPRTILNGTTCSTGWVEPKVNG